MFTFRQAIFCFVRYAQNRFCIFYGIIPAFFSSRCSVTHHRLPLSSLVLSPTDARVPALPSNATHLSEDPVQPASVSARLTAHALCTIHLADQRAPAAVFGINARCVVPGIRRYGALRCRGHSPIWRAALSRTFADMAHYVAPHVAVIRRGIDGRTSVY